jgi:hypothetical protein
MQDGYLAALSERRALKTLRSIKDDNGQERGHQSIRSASQVQHPLSHAHH